MYLHFSQSSIVQLIIKLRNYIVALRKVTGRDWGLGISQLSTIYCSNLLLYNHHPHQLSRRITIFKYPE
jgi:hypothetical protein